METDNTNQQVPPVQNIEQSQSAPLPNPSSHSKIFIIVLGIVFILLIGIGSYALGIRKNQTVNQQSITISPTIPQPSPTIDLNLESTSSTATANWKIYRNTKVGFEMKYPSHYQTPYVPVEGGLGSSKAVDGTEDYTTISFDEPSTHESRGKRITLNIFPYSKSLDDLVKDSYSGGSYNAGSYFDYDSPTKKVMDFFIDGQEARWYVTTKDKFGINNYINSDEESDMEIFFMGNNHAFMVQTRLDHVREELDQILSTFKFTN